MIIYILTILLLIIITILLIINCISYNNEKFINKKFFNELKDNNHLDKRYGVIGLSNKEKHDSLIKILKFFNNYCLKNNIKPIIMHGSLIGLYFNNSILPWDDDIDIILIDDSIDKIKNYETDNYIIEVNPFSKNRSKKDINNVIDARVISKNTGIFIDITFFYKYIENGVHKLTAKDTHTYNYNDICPIKKSIFCGESIYIPNNVKKCLIQEYGKNVLLPKYKNWIFKNNKWVIN